MRRNTTKIDVSSLRSPNRHKTYQATKQTDQIPQKNELHHFLKQTFLASTSIGSNALDYVLDQVDKHITISVGQKYVEAIIQHTDLLCLCLDHQLNIEPHQLPKIHLEEQQPEMNQLQTEVKHQYKMKLIQMQKQTEKKLSLQKLSKKGQYNRVSLRKMSRPIRVITNQSQLNESCIPLQDQKQNKQNKLQDILRDRCMNKIKVIQKIKDDKMQIIGNIKQEHYYDYNGQRQNLKKGIMNKKHDTIFKPICKIYKESIESIQTKYQKIFYNGYNIKLPKISKFIKHDDSLESKLEYSFSMNNTTIKKLT